LMCRRTPPRTPGTAIERPTNYQKIHGTFGEEGIGSMCLTDFGADELLLQLEMSDRRYTRNAGRSLKR
jgi:hypothetical protein